MQDQRHRMDGHPYVVMAFLGRSGFCDMHDMHDQVSTCAVPKVFATFFLTTCTIDLYTTSY